MLQRTLTLKRVLIVLELNKCLVQSFAERQLHLNIWFSTLEAICKELDCQPGDLFEYVKDE
ncbi:transcriptional regulator [Macrococcus epidermidis]|uniref:Transcriptional regulator n=1 Tax=Macrococcus epidermidis TaxID=1902580 RepID=A0A327ZSS2_9STAP|nr:transcriptional regulator [Macrococcus epidermidis]